MQTDADVSAARILAQGLAGPTDRGPLQAVTGLVCLQAQALSGALCSVALRTADRDLAAVCRALDRGGIVRSWTQRGTIHLVAAADLGWILDLTAGRMLRTAARRRAELGIDDAMIDRARDIVTRLIGGEGPVTRSALLAALAPLGVAAVPGRGYHVIAELAMRQVIVHGPLASGAGTGRAAAGVEQLIALTERWTRPGPRHDREEALAELMTRYVRGHGPATAADAARWAGLALTDARTGIAAGVASRAVAATQVGDATYFHAAELPDLLAAHRQDAQDLLLLPGFDELILGYADRSATLAQADEALVVPGRNGMFRNTVVHRTRAVGTWTRAPRGTSRGAARPVAVEAFPGRRVNLRAVQRAARRHPALAPDGRETG